MEREGVMGLCVLAHVESQRSFGTQSCPTDCQVEKERHYAPVLPEAPTSRTNGQTLQSFFSSFMS